MLRPNSSHCIHQRYAPHAMDPSRLVGLFRIAWFREKVDQKKLLTKFVRHVCWKISTHVNGGPSGGSSMRRPCNEDPIGVKAKKQQLRYLSWKKAKVLRYIGERLSVLSIWYKPKSMASVGSFSSTNLGIVIQCEVGVNC